MIIVEPSVKLLAQTMLVHDATTPIDKCSDGARLIERAGRVCWKSEDKAGVGSAEGFCDRVLRQFGHESISEHASATMHFVTDRIVSHQIVRARIAAYSQESTHYLNYSSGKFGRQIRVCKPHRLIGESEESTAYIKWAKAMAEAEENYFDLIENEHWKHYDARYVLPMGLKTELVATYNFRMWKHVVSQRTELKSNGTPKNTPEIHDLMKKAGRILANLCPEVFAEFGE